MSRLGRVGAVLALLLAMGCAPDEPAPEVTTAVGPDPDFAGCQQACGTHEPYDEADLVDQPGARVGDLARCPVSDAVFRIRSDQPTVEHDGVHFYVCCDSCAERFREEPARFATATRS